VDHKNPIDNWLKQSFEQTPSGDQGALWAKVSASLEQKKKKRFGFWWFMGGAAILGAVVVYFTTAHINPTPKQETPTISNTDKNTATNETLASDKTTTYKPESDAISAAKEESDLNKSSLKEGQNVDHSDLAQNNPRTNNGSKKVAEQGTEENLKTRYQRISQDQGTGTHNSNPDNPSPNKGKTETPMTNNSDLIKWKWLAIQIKPTLISTNYNKQSADLLNFIPFDLAILKGKENIDKPSIVLNNPWTIGLSVGVSPSKERISIASNSTPYVHKNYLNLRSAGERMMFNSQFEFYVRKNIGNFFIQSGYSSMKRGFIQDYQYEINEIPITTQINTTADANGRFPLDDQTPYLVDPTPEKVNYQGKRTSSFTEVPLNLGYTFNTGKLLISPSLGAGINFTQQSGGNTIDYQLLTIVEHSKLFKTNNTGYSFNSSLLIEYPLGKNLFLQAQPFYHQFLTGATEVITQKPISYGLNIGINLKLQNNE